MANSDKVSSFQASNTLPIRSSNRKLLQKRRAERKLKELWQFVDANYFLKINKKLFISRINRILRSNLSSNFIKNFIRNQTNPADS